MATIFYAMLYSRFTEIKSNFGRKKLDRTNQMTNFLGGSLSKEDNVRAPIQFRIEKHSFGRSNNTGTIDVKMDGSVLVKK